jgi:hypothetical protein
VPCVEQYVPESQHILPKHSRINHCTENDITSFYFISCHSSALKRDMSLAVLYRGEYEKHGHESPKHRAMLMLAHWNDSVERCR